MTLALDHGPRLHVETATVYRAAGRRYFTKKAAIHRLALKRVKDKHHCECEPDVGYTCGVHDGDWFNRVVARYERILKRVLCR